MSDQYDADYFLRGRETGKSLYDNYRWMPELTIPMVRAIVKHCDMFPGASVLDFGCARGYVVRAFRHLGYRAFGVDASEWAIANADEAAKSYLTWVHSSLPLSLREADWVIAKDVLEHVRNIEGTIPALMDAATVGVFAVVPLAPFDGGKYVVSDYEKDVTHIHRLSLPTWAAMFTRPGWAVDMRYRLHGVKDNYAQYPDGNGFIVARRIGG